MLPLAPGMKELVQTSAEAATQLSTDANTPSANSPVIFLWTNTKEQISSSGSRSLSRLEAEISC